MASDLRATTSEQTRLRLDEEPGSGQAQIRDAVAVHVADPRERPREGLVHGLLHRPEERSGRPRVSVRVAVDERVRGDVGHPVTVDVPDAARVSDAFAIRPVEMAEDRSRRAGHEVDAAVAEELLALARQRRDDEEVGVAVAVEVADRPEVGSELVGGLLRDERVEEGSGPSRPDVRLASGMGVEGADGVVADAVTVDVAEETGGVAETGLGPVVVEVAVVRAQDGLTDAVAATNAMIEAEADARRRKWGRILFPPEATTGRNANDQASVRG